MAQANPNPALPGKGFRCHPRRMEIEPLEALPEDWERALCVVAHPDDMEFGAAAAVARWTGQGKEVVYCMVTGQCRGVRDAEQVASAQAVGVPVVELLGQPDGILEYGLPLRAAIARV